MAVTVEEIEIIVRAKVEEALKELRKVQSELQKIGAASLSNIVQSGKNNRAFGLQSGGGREEIQ